MFTHPQAKFKHQKQQELIALQKRIQTGREEQKKQRELDLERYAVQRGPGCADCCCCSPACAQPAIHRLLQRYRNVKNELEAQQNLERIRMERMTQGAMAV